MRILSLGLTYVAALTLALSLSACSQSAVDTVREAKLAYNPSVTVNDAFSAFKGCREGSVAWAESGKGVTASCLDTDFFRFVKVFHDGAANALGKSQKRKDQEILSALSLKEVRTAVDFSVSDQGEVSASGLTYTLIWEDGTTRTLNITGDKMEQPLTALFHNELCFYNEKEMSDPKALKGLNGSFATLIVAGIMYALHKGQDVPLDELMQALK
ncbi:MAG TPA: hypothetical protein IAB18_05035 [Candidatus Avisuccinivibrio pullicola]|nr:hypothetical protein [Candidatus Avisuccinivibrio pullicola]